MRATKRFFCASVPNFMIAGPTHQMPIWPGTPGAFTRVISSERIACSMSESPAPPYSFGHAAPRNPPS
jgi:hypothetical protein